MEFFKKAEQIVLNLKKWDTVNIRWQEFTVDNRNDDEFTISSEDFDTETLFLEELLEEVLEQLWQDYIDDEQERGLQFNKGSYE